MSYAHVLAGRKGVGASKRRSKEHYQRMARIARERNYVPQEQRFWKHILKANDPLCCWGWVGATNQHGYGVHRWNGKNRLAPRIMWELTNGQIPENSCVLHRCDNPPCCNPDHLFLGTKLDNTRDMFLKGRDRVLRGEQQPNHKLTEQDVCFIRATKGNRPELAKRYGVTKHAIDDVRARRSWKHVP